MSTKFTFPELTENIPDITDVEIDLLLESALPTPLKGEPLVVDSIVVGVLAFEGITE
jgi:hypothetical protein